MSRKIVAVIAAVVTVVGVGAYRYVQRSHRLPDGLLQVNGRIEGDTTIIASKQPGRVGAIHVEDGDLVHAGQLLIELDDRAARARLAAAQAAAASAQAQSDQSRAELAVLCAQVPYGIDSARAAVTGDEAALKQAEAEEQQAQRERDRYRSLADSGAVGEEIAEQAALRWSLARDGVVNARAALGQSRQALKDVELGPKRIAAKQAELAAFEAAAQAANARLEEAHSVLDDLTIESPADGAVTMRLADLGEVVAAGTPLLEVVDLDRLYLKAFVPEVEIGHVHIGQRAHVYIDALPDTPFSADVRNIAARPEFTPKEIQTARERVNLVYAVRLYLLENPDHRLTPGLPADAVIRWREETPWAKPRW